jgi:hypothetical protein
MMKPGFYYVAERGEPGYILERIIGAYAREGVSLVNPASGRTTELDDEGNQVDISYPKLIEAARSRTQLTLQLWLSSDTDVDCSFRLLSQGLVGHAYSFDGKDRGERRRLVDWAIAYFRQAIADKTAILLVVDPPGRTADFDWAQVITDQVEFPAALPGVLGVPSDWVSRLPVTHQHKRKTVGAFELLTTDLIEV